MDVGLGDVPAEADEEYVHFFRSLGIVDKHKLGFLARMLEAFYEMANKLDEHLAPTGAVLHAAISRMCEADIPMDAPQHRWIRIHDRLGFFSDADEHASRVINLGLAYAYRHKELEGLSQTHALRLEQLRLSAARDGGELVPAPHGKHDQLPAGDDDVPEGGMVIRNDAGGRANSLASGGGEAASDGRVASALVSELPPPGGWTLRGDHPPGASGVDDADELPAVGGKVVARRHPLPDPPVPQDAQAAPLVEIAGSTNATECSSKPMIKPSDAAVSCVKSVLEIILTRNDCKEVLRKLHVDGLLCLARLHSGQAAYEMSGVVSAEDEEKGWPAVRILLKKWWPSWSLPAGASPVLPIEGTAARITNSTRPTLSSKWVVGVDMSNIKPVIERLGVSAQRYFKSGALPISVDVVRMAPSLKPPMWTTIASMLLIGTWDASYCSFVLQLASAGRAPVPPKAPLDAAACHNFESAGLRDPAAILPAPAADHIAMTVPPPAPAERPLAELLSERQAEVDDLLVADKARTATANRAHRVDARRRAAPPSDGLSRGTPALSSQAAPRGPGGRAKRTAAARRPARSPPAAGCGMHATTTRAASASAGGGSKRVASSPSPPNTKRPKGDDPALSASQVTTTPHGASLPFPLVSTNAPPLPSAGQLVPPTQSTQAPVVNHALSPRVEPLPLSLSRETANTLDATASTRSSPHASFSTSRPSLSFLSFGAGAVANSQTESTTTPAVVTGVGDPPSFSDRGAAAAERLSVAALPPHWLPTSPRVEYPSRDDDLDVPSLSGEDGDGTAGAE